MKRPLIAIVGVGDLAGHILNTLVQFPETSNLVLASRNKENLQQKANLALFVASQFDRYPKINYTPMDVWQVEQTAEKIAKIKPDIILNCSTLQSWRVIRHLPKEVYTKLDRAEYGPWLPMSLVPNYKLMQAVKLTDLDIKVINAACPDGVNPVLSQVGMAPTMGVGTIANIIPVLRKSIAFILGKTMPQVQVTFLAEHYLTYSIPRFGRSGDAPFYLKATVDGEDVTHQLDIQQVFSLVSTRFRREVGVEGAHRITASSVGKLMLAMVNDTGELMHVPGPSGLPGGYPVKVNAEGATVTLPEDLSFSEAVRINSECQKWNGIEKIETDGTVHFADKNMAVMNEVLGYHCKTMKLEECEERAKELEFKYAEFAQKHQN